MEFQTEWNYKSEPTNPGSEFLPQFIETIDKKGKRILKEIEPKNVYAQIQAESEGAEIYDVIEKYLETGDETLLQKRKAIFGDFTKVPNNPHEIHNMISEAESQFEQMDREIRNEFENDVGVFKQSIIDGTFEDKIAHYIGQKTKAEKAAEVQKEFENQKSEVKKGE